MNHGGCDFTRPKNSSGRGKFPRQIGIPVILKAMLLLAFGLVFGEYPARVDLIDAYPVLLHERITEVAGEGHEGTLGGGVGEKGRFPAMGVHAADVDYASRALA